jgi:hypothetical protein
MNIIDIAPSPTAEAQRPNQCRAYRIFSDFTRLAAYGSSVLVWRSPQVCWDGLKILEVSRDTIKGIGYDPTNSITHESCFAVDLKTGRSLLPPPSSNDGKPVW